MQQLSGLDASFLYLETGNATQHIGSLSIYNPSTAPGGSVNFQQILQNTKVRASSVPSMVNKLVNVPWHLDHPYWKADGDFDPEYHIRRSALPSPGDWQQLRQLLSRLHSKTLDRTRPLWEMYIIEGLDNVEGYPAGCYAVYTKVHHAAIDGVSGMNITAAVHDLTPDVTIPEEVPVKSEDTPGNFDLLVRAQWNNLTRPWQMLQFMQKAIPGMTSLGRKINAESMKRFTRVVRTRFNKTVSPQRVFDGLEFDFEDIRKIKSSIELLTINDVALAICGGAMRKYLLSKGELPKYPIIAIVPINVQTEDQKSSGGNQVSQMMVSLCTDIEHPLERLVDISSSTKDAKELTNAIGAKNMTDYTQFIPSTLAASAARLIGSFGVANYSRPVFNTIVTNVPGPQVPLYYTGAKLLATYGLGPIADGAGLFHSVGSYCGKLFVSFVCCRDMMEDPEFYSQCLRESFDELKEAAESI
jgi:diacylglycerol O-acyltransferase